MNPTAIYSKSGKGVQEASGKTSLLKRPDRAVLSAIDGRANLKEVAEKVGRAYDAAFQAVIQQLDKDGFIREVSAGAASGAPLAPPSRPAPAKPAARPAAPADPASDLDFSSLGGASRPAPPPPPQRPAPPPPPRPAAAPPPKPAPVSPQQAQQAKAQMSALDKAREEAEAKAAEQRERVRREAEEKARAELEAKMRADAEQKMKEEAEARARAAVAAEAEAKVKAAREAALRAAAEAKARAEAEARAKAEAERKAEEERKAREEMARRLEEERKAREEAERKAREEAERARREAEEKARREAEELRQRLEAERKAREEAERRAKEEAERARREAEEKARREAEELRQRLEAERKAREDAERRAKEEAERARRQREEEEARRAEAAAAEAAAQAAAQAAIAAPAPEPAAAKSGSFADTLMADLDSFTNRETDEQKRQEEQQRRQQADSLARAEADLRRREQEVAEARRREEEEARRREEDKRKAREEEERIAREEERRKREAEEIKRKAEAATAAAMAKQAAAPEEDIPIDEDDLDMSEVKEERKALGIDEKKERQKQKEAEREAKRNKRAEEKRRREAEKAAAKTAAPLPGAARGARRSSSWGRPVALLLAVVLIGAVGAAHFMPLDVAPYEQAATQALDRPVKIGSAHLWLFTGVQIRFDGVRIGDARIGRVVAHPALGALLGDEKQFNLIELERVALPQAALADALFSKVKGERFSVERIALHDLDLQGGFALPKLDADIALGPSGALRSATLRGPDGLEARVVPKGEALQFDVTAAGFPLPIGPELTLSQFAMKGTATRQGIDIAEWGGALFNGGISGNAKLHWDGTWRADGVVTVRAINAAVFAPALLSQGNGEGTARFSMASADPAKLLASSRLDGRFTISRGTLGSFDLSRAIQSRGKQTNGITQFSELTGQASYDHGSVALRNVTIGAGALNAGASADISRSGALTGRIVADVKSAGQTFSATLNLGGTVKEPQVRD